MLDKLKESKVLQFAVVAFISAAAGALLYPTKHVEEKTKEHYEQELLKQREEFSKKEQQVKEDYTRQVETLTSKKSELESKVTSLTIENRTLQAKQKTAKFKIVRPDGTIEEREFSSSEVNESTQVVTKIQQEFKQKVEEIETKWEKVHKERVTKLREEFSKKEQDYQKTIRDLESTKIVDTNKRSGALEVGVLSNGNMYIHPSYDVFGPFFLGVHAEGPVMNTTTQNRFSAGAGLGIRF